MKLRLLATDPDPILLEIYRAYFPSFGFDVATARDGVKCVELLRDYFPDVLILSLELTWGGADGVLAVVREETAMRPIPIILTVAAMNQSKAVTLLRPPVIKLLEKPFRLRDLRAIIEATLHSQAERLIPRALNPSALIIADREQAADSGSSLTTRIH